MVPMWSAKPDQIIPREKSTRFRAQHGIDGQVVLYAGNLGYTQGFETLVEAARLSGDRISLEIVGAGNAADRVWQLSRGLPNITVRPPVSLDDYPALLASADVQLVIQRRISAGANASSQA